VRDCSVASFAVIPFKVRALLARSHPISCVPFGCCYVASVSSCVPCRALVQVLGYVLSNLTCHFGYVVSVFARAFYRVHALRLGYVIASKLFCFVASGLVIATFRLYRTKLPYQVFFYRRRVPALLLVSSTVGRIPGTTFLYCC
jgi:hypothetical protein